MLFLKTKLKVKSRNVIEHKLFLPYTSNATELNLQIGF